MHIKITRVLGNEEVAESNSSYTKRSGSTEELIVPISSISLSKIQADCRSLYIYDKTLYQVYIHRFQNNLDKTISVSEEEYNRIEHLLAFNNKKEIEILSNSYPEINTKSAIESLQLNED